MRRRRHAFSAGQGPFTPAGPPLDHATIAQTVHKIREHAGQEGIRVALIGGVALQHYGSQRLTADVDVVANRVMDPSEDLRSWHRLSFGGEAMMTSGGVKVDVIVRRDHYANLYRASLRSSLKLPQIEIPIVRPEYLVAMKLQANRKKDLQDLIFLARLGALNHAAVLRILAKYLDRESVKDWQIISSSAMRGGT